MCETRSFAVSHDRTTRRAHVEVEEHCVIVCSSTASHLRKSQTHEGQLVVKVRCGEEDCADDERTRIPMVDVAGLNHDKTASVPVKANVTRPLSSVMKMRRLRILNDGANIDELSHQRI